MAQSHFIQLKLGGKTSQPTKISLEGCTHVDDFLGAIKNEFSPELDSYARRHLNLFHPDGITEIDPQTLVSDLNEIPWNPIIVTL